MRAARTRWQTSLLALCARNGETPQLASIRTPAALIDTLALQRNILRMQQRADGAGVALRPHIKTHKCMEIAKLQLAAGATGVTASKPYEALAFIERGVPSVTIAYPFLEKDGVHELLQSAAEHGCRDLRFVVDSQAGLRQLAMAVNSSSTRFSESFPVYIKVDVGLHRCGVDPSAPGMLLEVARALEAEPSLHLCGLLSHAGQAYGAAGADECRKIGEGERQLMLAARDTLVSAGLVGSTFEISVGATPTELARTEFSGITELRPGNYALMDRTPLRLNLAQPQDVALCVLATVVSTNSRFAIIDAGSKVVSSDKGAHGADGMSNFGHAFSCARYDDFVEGRGAHYEVASLSEEHGWLRRLPDAPVLGVGDRVLLVPNHSCPIVNLSDELCSVSVSDAGEVTHEYWPVICRGAVHGAQLRRGSQ